MYICSYLSDRDSRERTVPFLRGENLREETEGKRKVRVRVGQYKRLVWLHIAGPDASLCK